MRMNIGPDTRCRTCGLPANTCDDGRCVPCVLATTTPPQEGSMTGVCRCGCSEPTRTRRAKYLPGHDSKHVSITVRDLRAKTTDVTSRDEFDRLATSYAVDRFELGSGIRAKFNRAADRLWVDAVAVRNHRRDRELGL